METGNKLGPCGPLARVRLYLPILEIKLNKVYQALDGRLIKVTTMEELSLGRPKMAAAA